MKYPHTPRLTFLILSLTNLQLISAQTTLLPSADARPRQQAAPVSAVATDPNRLGVGPVNGSADYFRSYLAFDLTNVEFATEVTLTLSSANAPESNTAVGFTQNFTVFQVASDWDGVSPLPNGTDLASTELTLGTTAISRASLSFTSADLATAFNNAIGGTLYLGVYSPEGEAAPTGTRSFLWLSSTESSSAGGGSEPGAQPSLSYFTDSSNPTLTALTYDSATGDSQITLSGTPGSRYQLVEASDLDFSTPDQDPVALTTASVGTLDGNVIVLDGSGNAIVQFNLGAAKATSFIRAETAP